MYLEHFGFTRPPFQITPDADFFYPGAERQSTLEGLIHSAQHNEGIVKLIGEIGSGKSLLCRMLAAKLPDNFQVVFLANPHLKPTEVVEAILADLGITPQPETFSLPSQLLQTYLLEQNRQNNRVLLLVEEAQAMPAETLEALRLLTNLETAETKLLRMILFGQPELDQTLSDYSLRQFRDRITQNFYLRAMRLDESGEYLHHRLNVAGYRGDPLFHGELLRKLHAATGGRLRPLNIIADKTLLAAYVDDSLELTDQHLHEALQEIVPLNSAALTHEAITWRGVGIFFRGKATTIAKKLWTCLQYTLRKGRAKIKRWHQHLAD
ncbi:MAG: type II secretion protein ATPase [Gammaproteobacteria bacterium]|nr:MAG: type II secretion protein ATPase [Gammaproteobacteria bacterium]RLA15756.1 MAG: type II secretion protein ATPase [Gammaproteobacteria bacterium]RLA17130.1 MAG: type II secretion protein ATPase [Gammaproteobacteria bacterium]